MMGAILESPFLRLTVFSRAPLSWLSFRVSTDLHGPRGPKGNFQIPIDGGLADRQFAVEDRRNPVFYGVNRGSGIWVSCLKKKVCVASRVTLFWGIAVSRCITTSSDTWLCPLWGHFTGSKWRCMALFSCFLGKRAPYSEGPTLNGAIWRVAVCVAFFGGGSPNSAFIQVDGAGVVLFDNLSVMIQRDLRGVP